jgi:hypothetical protein
MKKFLLFTLIVVLAICGLEKHHLKKAILHPAEALKSLNFTKIVSKWGDIMLHRETEQIEEVIL